MSTTVENLGDNVPTEPVVSTGVPPTAGVTEIQANTYKEMLAILNDLVAHTHIFYDDYNTNCNCNCNCNCTRGIL